MENKYLILVNPSHPMTDENLFTTINCESKYDSKCTAEVETLAKFRKLQQFIKDNGYTIDIESGYRSKEHQQEVWDETLEAKGLEHTKKYVAVPGYSEHQTGLAIDFTLYENGNWYVDHDMKGHKVLDLVAENAYKFGFIIRYPEGKEKITGYNNEPWHLRYVANPQIAKYIKDNNLCLEEYLSLQKAPRNLTRFIETQQSSYATALEEIKNGHKKTHWIWYIFPQLLGLGMSDTADYYGINGLSEAIEYLNNDYLRNNLLTISNALLELKSNNIEEILPYPDNLKLQSSMTLFSLANPEEPIFMAVLNKYYNGEMDQNTIQKIESQKATSIKM